MSNGRPTITVDLETLEISLKGLDGMVGIALNRIRVEIAERRDELNRPAPGPWQAVGVLVRDADDKHLSERDTKRAAMAPELASCLMAVTVAINGSAEHVPDHVACHYDLARELLARFDNPEGET